MVRRRHFQNIGKKTKKTRLQKAKTDKEDAMQKQERLDKMRSGKYIVNKDFVLKMWSKGWSDYKRRQQNTIEEGNGEKANWVQVLLIWTQVLFFN